MKIKDSLEPRQQTSLGSEIDKTISSGVFWNLDAFIKLASLLFVERDLQIEAEADKSNDCV